MSEQKLKGSDAVAGRLADAACFVSKICFQVMCAGIKAIRWRNRYVLLNAVSLLMLAYLGVATDADVYLIYLILPRWIGSAVVPHLLEVAFVYRFGVVVIALAGAILFVIGVKPYRRKRQVQQELESVAIKNGLGEVPRVLSVVDAPPYRTKVLIHSQGMGLDRYETRKSDLEAALGANIESMKPLGSPKRVEITLTKSKIPDVCHFSDLIAEVKTPYSIVIGESLGGLISRSIRKLPHLLIAGTTGGGKSVFFKQALLSLLKTSSHIQLYLLDLKRGVEVKEFSQIPNVVVAKNENEAIQMLRNLKQEMERRFQYMEESGYKSIDPERDQMDLIVVGVDEASVLYGKSSGRSKGAALTQEARDLTDNLAKLARAAGIHLILATQKVVKETIDTKVQENIGGRMCFRVNTLQGSLTVLGNKMAYMLPDRPGRAIWASGNDFTEVQAPLITDEEIQIECVKVAKEYEDGVRKNYGTMLSLQEIKPDAARPADCLDRTA